MASRNQSNVCKAFAPSTPIFISFLTIKKLQLFPLNDLVFAFRKRWVPKKLLWTSVAGVSELRRWSDRAVLLLLGGLGHRFPLSPIARMLTRRAMSPRRLISRKRRWRLCSMKRRRGTPMIIRFVL